MPIARLERTLIRLSGEGVKPWLEGLITNSLKSDITFAALLTPQGKIIADFFVHNMGEDLILETPTKFGPDLLKRLKMYKLRAPITLTDDSENLSVYAIWDGQGQEGVTDPRQPSLGQRLLSPDVLDSTGDYNAHRLSLGIIDSEWDFDTQSVFPADANMDLMSGVDYQKGCFVGQEVVSRMKRMTIVKKRMRGLVFEQAVQTSAGDKIKCGERVVGEICSVHDKMGVGIIRLERLKSATQNPKVGEIEVKIMGAPDGSDT